MHMCTGVVRRVPEELQVREYVSALVFSFDRTCVLMFAHTRACMRVHVCVCVCSCDRSCVLMCTHTERVCVNVCMCGLIVRAYIHAHFHLQHLHTVSYMYVQAHRARAPRGAGGVALLLDAADAQQG